MRDQQPTYHGIDMLPVITDLIEGMHSETDEMFRSLSEARTKPWALDDETWDRTDRLFAERLEFLAINAEQLRRWTRLTLPADQRREVGRLQGLIPPCQARCQDILDLSQELRQGTINRILEADDFTLGLAALSQEFEEAPVRPRKRRPLKTKQVRVAAKIDKRVQTLRRSGVDGADLFAVMGESMADFEYLMDTARDGDLEELCLRYEGLFVYVQLLEAVAAGIASGDIRVP